MWIPPYQFISTLLKANFDFDVSVANGVAIDVAKCVLPGKVVQGSPCPEVRALTNENSRYMMKLNDMPLPPHGERQRPEGVLYHLYRLRQ